MDSPMHTLSCPPVTASSTHPAKPLFSSESFSYTGKTILHGNLWSGSRQTVPPNKYLCWDEVNHFWNWNKEFYSLKGLSSNPTSTGFLICKMDNYKMRAPAFVNINWVVCKGLLITLRVEYALMASNRHDKHPTLWQRSAPELACTIPRLHCFSAEPSSWDTGETYKPLLAAQQVNDSVDK